jgi:hypothetical protein
VEKKEEDERSKDEECGWRGRHESARVVLLGVARAGAQAHIGARQNGLVIATFAAQRGVLKDGGRRSPAPCLTAVARQPLHTFAPRF